MCKITECIYISTLFRRIFPKLVSNSNPTALLIIMCIQYSQHLYQQYTLSVNYPTAGLTHALITPHPPPALPPVIEMDFFLRFDTN